MAAHACPRARRSGKKQMAIGKFLRILGAHSADRKEWGSEMQTVKLLVVALLAVPLGRADLLVLYDWGAPLVPSVPPNAFGFFTTAPGRMFVECLSTDNNCVGIFGPGDIVNGALVNPAPTTIVSTTLSTIGIGAGDGTIGDILIPSVSVGSIHANLDLEEEQPNSTFPPANGSPGSLCSTAVFPLCSVTANGAAQLAGTITWSDGTVDTVEFVADYDPVPEPASVLLLLTALGTLMMMSQWRRR
jgi:hypothetical protein